MFKSSARLWFIHDWILGRHRKWALYLQNMEARSNTANTIKKTVYPTQYSGILYRLSVKQVFWSCQLYSTVLSCFGSWNVLWLATNGHEKDGHSLLRHCRQRADCKLRYPNQTNHVTTATSYIPAWHWSTIALVLPHMKEETLGMRLMAMTIHAQRILK